MSIMAKILGDKLRRYQEAFEKEKEKLGVDELLKDPKYKNGWFSIVHPFDRDHECDPAFRDYYYYKYFVYQLERIVSETEKARTKRFKEMGWKPKLEKLPTYEEELREVARKIIEDYSKNFSHRTSVEVNGKKAVVEQSFNHSAYEADECNEYIIFQSPSDGSSDFDIYAECGYISLGGGKKGHYFKYYLDENDSLDTKEFIFEEL